MKVILRKDQSLKLIFILLRENISMRVTNIPTADVHMTSVLVSLQLLDTNISDVIFAFLGSTTEFLEDAFTIKVS